MEHDQGTSVERRVEVPGHREPNYATTRMTPEGLSRGKHRNFVGGMWETVGRLQLDFLVEQGLRPGHRFLDVGCGSLRAGVHLVDHLGPGNYYGIDINADLIVAGYDHELDGRQRARLPLENLRSTDRFDADFGVRFDMAIAQSVFTHVSLNQIRLCLFRIAKVMRPGGKFYTTFNERGRRFPVDGVPQRSPKYTERNVYWYYRDDLRWCAQFSPWEFRYVGKWGHPRGQRMIEFTRLAD